eukprot:2774310-Prymnesium_polylepis.1
MPSDLQHVASHARTGSCGTSTSAAAHECASASPSALPSGRKTQPPTRALAPRAQSFLRTTC